MRKIRHNLLGLIAAVSLMFTGGGHPVRAQEDCTL